jgi:hypothetical protein
MHGNKSPFSPRFHIHHEWIVSIISSAFQANLIYGAVFVIKGKLNRTGIDIFCLSGDVSDL